MFNKLGLDHLATISAVLYANTNHPEFKIEYPNWNERCKQILKKWRALSTEKKAPYLQKARENRSCLKKAQQVSDKKTNTILFALFFFFPPFKIIFKLFFFLSLNQFAMQKNIILKIKLRYIKTFKTHYQCTEHV